MMKHALFWIRNESDFNRLLQIVIDPDNFGESYVAWVQSANQMLEVQRRQGLVLTKIYADPDEFAEWCRVNSRSPDRQSRILYAAQKFSEESPSDN